MLLRIVRRERRCWFFVGCDIILRSPWRGQDVRMIALGRVPSLCASCTCFRRAAGGRDAGDAVTGPPWLKPLERGSGREIFRKSPSFCKRGVRVLGTREMYS